MGRQRLGELMIERGTLTREQLDSGLAYQRQSGLRLGAALVQQGVLSEESLARALALALGLELHSLAGRKIDPAVLLLVPARLCEAHDLLPVALETDSRQRILIVAMGDPLNHAAIEEIEFLTGLRVQCRVALLSEVRLAILQHHRRPGARSPGHPTNELMSSDLPTARARASSGGGARTRLSESVPLLPSLPKLPDIASEARRPSRPEGFLARPLTRGNTAVSRPLSRELPSFPSRTTDAGGAEDLAELIRAKEEAVHRAHAELGAALRPTEANEELERVELQHWALLRLMAKKGLITREEFLAEFGD